MSLRAIEVELLIILDRIEVQLRNWNLKSWCFLLLKNWIISYQEHPNQQPEPTIKRWFWLLANGEKTEVGLKLRVANLSHHLQYAPAPVKSRGPSLPLKVWWPQLPMQKVITPFISSRGPSCSYVEIQNHLNIFPPSTTFIPSNLSLCSALGKMNHPIWLIFLRRLKTTNSFSNKPNVFH